MNPDLLDGVIHIMSWKLQSYLWKFLPADRAVNLSLYVFGVLLLLTLVVFVIGCFARRRWLSRVAAAVAAMVLLVWGLLFVTRPAWLRIALQPVVPMPTASALLWETRSPGLETAELELRVGDVVVDHMMLVRLDPHRYRFSVHWDPTGTRLAEDWQRELGAAVVVNGSYFGDKFVPLTPLRTSGRPAGPESYQSTHGAFVADGSAVDILDLKDRDVFQAIGKFPEAMVSYPLLIDADGENRAVESKTWLASRNFVALDESNRVVLGTTETGFFSIHRLGDFLKAAPLGLRVALNFDGGPLVSQVVSAGQFSRAFHGRAEISNGADVLRVFWHEHFRSSWTLPIVLVAVPIQP